MQKTSVISPSFTLGKNERLKSRKLIERVFREGQRLTVSPIRLHYLFLGGEEKAPGPNAVLQAGFGASTRHFKKAVDRNRIKRLLREAYRLQKEPVYQQLRETNRRVAVFFIFTGKELPDYPTLYGKIGITLQKFLQGINA